MKKSNQADLIKQMTNKEVVRALYLTQFALLLLSFVLMPIVLEDLAAFKTLFQWSLFDILFWGAGSGLAVVGLDLFLMNRLPDKYYDDGGVNEKLFANRSAGGIFMIAFVVAVAEELFFRGILQTALGFAAASLIFALVHIRYLFKWYLTLNVVLLSFGMGWLFEMTGNLAVTITMHFIIDFMLGLAIRNRSKKKSFIKKG